MNRFLRQARLSAGLTQQQLADLIGTSLLSIWRWEHGTLPSPIFRQRLCAFFQKSEAELGFSNGEGSPSTVLRSTPGSLDPALPSLLMPLIGRDTLLHQLKQEIGHMRGMIGLHGLPGIGKTALAQALAADPDVQQAFSDGILWMNLGKNPSLGQQFARWTLLLHPHVEEYFTPRTLDEQASRAIWGERLRNIIGTRRMLLIFDDIWSMEDLLACQVAGPQCVSLVTTRFPRIACSALQTYHIHELNEDESLTLLAQYAPLVLEQETQPVRRLVRAVGGHPLALVLIGMALRIESHTGQLRRMQAALERLMDASERLHLAFPNISTVTPVVSLCSTIATSEQTLDQEAREALRLLAQQVSEQNALLEEELASVATISLQALDRLCDVGLVESVGSGGYRLHPVIADYARAVL
jgi:transcriptional regulator with XRE-family HTH domain